MYTSTLVTDIHGGRRKSATVIESGSFLANVNFSKLDKIKENYGIQEDIEMTITTNTNVPTGQIIGYLDKKLEILRSIPFDSHYLLIAKKWLSKSLDSVSL